MKEHEQAPRLTNTPDEQPCKTLWGEYFVCLCCSVLHSQTDGSSPPRSAIILQAALVRPPRTAHD